MLFKYMNRRYRVIFAITFLCLLVIAGTALTIGYLRKTEISRANYANTMRTDAQSVMNYVDQQFDAALNTANGIFGAKWFSHYRNVANVYESEFTAIRKQEIMQELGSKVAVLPIVEDIMIITPSMDSVISKNGWMSLERYGMVYGDIAIEQNASFGDAPTIRLMDDSYAAYVLNDIELRREKSVACVLLSRRRFASALERIMPSTVMSIEAFMNGEAMLTVGEAMGGTEIITLSRRAPDFYLNVVFQNFEAYEGAAARTKYIFEMCAMILICLLTAALVALITTRPMSEMIMSFGGEARDLDNPYQFIYAYVEAYSRHADRLQMRVDHLGNARDHFIELMRNEIFIGILTNPEFNFGDEYITSFLPWIDDGSPSLLALAAPVREGLQMALDNAQLEQGAQHTARANLLGSCCVFLWYDSVQAADAARERISGYLTGQRNLISALSDVLTEPEEFRTAYAQLSAELRDRRREREEMPVAAQIALADSLRRHNEDACMEVLQKFIEADYMDAPMRFLLRDALEAGLNAEPFSSQFNSASNADERRDALKGILHALIKDEHDAHAGSDEESVNSEIVSYIRTHYNEPELCVMQLADKFDMHRTLISKAVKAATGVTFSDYLQTLRLGKAIELLESGDRSLSDIAGEIGYASYLSFKRAFVRCYGVSPREYRENVMYTKQQNM